eukprot:scaffold116351_cov48-Phaeocystis_antarctica.AAC.1
MAVANSNRLAACSARQRQRNRLDQVPLECGSLPLGVAAHYRASSQATAPQQRRGHSPISQTGLLGCGSPPRHLRSGSASEAQGRASPTHDGKRLTNTQTPT